MKNIILILALVLAFGLMGCVGETTTDDGNVSTVDGETSDVNSGEEETDFWEFLNTKTSGEWYVNYNVIENGNIVGVTKMYKSGDKIRTDIETGDTEARAYMDGTMYYICANSQVWICYSIDTSENNGDIEGKVDSELQANKDKYTVAKVSDRNVAGTTASCYTINGIEESNVEYCFSKEGIPLYTKITGGDNGDIITEATEYSTSVSNSDFVLPAEPQKFGNLGY